MIGPNFIVGAYNMALIMLLNFKMFYVNTFKYFKTTFKIIYVDGKK